MRRMTKTDVFDGSSFIYFVFDSWFVLLGKYYMLPSTLSNFISCFVLFGKFRTFPAQFVVGLL